jgi:hypothetical protein
MRREQNPLGIRDHCPGIGVGRKEWTANVRSPETFWERGRCRNIDRIWPDRSRNCCRDFYGAELAWPAVEIHLCEHSSIARGKRHCIGSSSRCERWALRRRHDIRTGQHAPDLHGVPLTVPTRRRDTALGQLTALARSDACPFNRACNVSDPWVRRSRGYISSARSTPIARSCPPHFPYSASPAGRRAIGLPRRKAGEMPAGPRSPAPPGAWPCLRTDCRAFGPG